MNPDAGDPSAAHRVVPPAAEPENDEATSPAEGADGDAAASPFLYLTTAGRRSGRPHRVEMWYVEIGGRCYLISELRERADWVRNILADPGVTFEVTGRAVHGHGRIVSPTDEPDLAANVRAAFDARYGWSHGTIVALESV